MTVAEPLTIQHRRRLTRINLQGNDAGLKRFRDALLLKDFIVTHEQADRLELRRRAYLSQDDWPMRISIRRDGRQFEIDCYLFIPWGWIAIFTFLMFMILPFAGVPNATLAFGLAMVMAALAIYQRRFDCRPDARYWQQRSRRRWGETLERLARDAFLRP